MESPPNFGFLLKDISRLYSRNFERHVSRLNLTLNQCRVLLYLARNEGICQARLAYLAETDPMTLGRILNRMEAKGVVERKPNPDDRRVRTLFLRAPSAALLRTIWHLSDLALAESLSGVSAKEKAQLMDLLSRIHANLDSLVPGMADGGARPPGPARRRSRVRTALTEA